MSQIEVGTNAGLSSGTSWLYAGFWRRFWAYLLDGIILFVVSGLVYTVAFAVSFGIWHRFDELSLIDIDSAYRGNIVGHVFSFVLPWLYYALFESSTKQATLGKIAFEIYVTDLEGRRITFARASARYFCMILISPLTFGIGFVMAGLTAKRQALHDKIAECLVLRRS
jgi:uncharacterized RDD family membrane protein YckC